MYEQEEMNRLARHVARTMERMTVVEETQRHLKATLDKLVYTVTNLSVAIKILIKAEQNRAARG
jgi:hypothetical protein